MKSRKQLDSTLIQLQELIKKKIVQKKNFDSEKILSHTSNQEPGKDLGNDNKTGLWVNYGLAGTPRSKVDESDLDRSFEDISPNLVDSDSFGLSSTNVY